MSTLPAIHGRLYATVFAVAAHGESAAVTGLSETTVGEHLRETEATVFSSLHVGVTDR